jgi:hypothetical protein
MDRIDTPRYGQSGVAVTFVVTLSPVLTPAISLFAAQ